MKYLLLWACVLLVQSCSDTPTESNTLQWEVINKGLPLLGSYSDAWSSINCIAVSGSIIIAGCEEGVFLSTDMGANWTSKSNGLPDNPYVTCIVVKGNTIFIGTEIGGVFRSMDNGNSWTAQNNGIIHSKITSLATNGIYLYAGTGNGIFVSEDNGESWTANGNQWTAKKNAIPGSEIKSIIPGVADIYVAAKFFGIYKSSDNCVSWKETSVLPNISPLCLAIDDTVFYAGTQSGLFLSLDQGKTWTPKNKGTPLPESWPFTVYSIAIKGNMVFTGMMDKGVYLSKDKGENWRSVGPYKTYSSSPNPQKFYPDVNSILIHNNYVFIACSYGVYKASLSEF